MIFTNRLSILALARGAGLSSSTLAAVLASGCAVARAAQPLDGIIVQGGHHA